MKNKKAARTCSGDLQACEARVRSLIHFVLFDPPSHQANDDGTFAQQISDAFLQYLQDKDCTTLCKMRIALGDRSPALDDGTFVFWKKDRLKYAAACYLECALPYFRFEHAPFDQHIDTALKCLVDGTAIPEDMLQTFQLRYYWDEEAMTYLGIAMEFTSEMMSDEEFASLDNWVEYLNQAYHMGVSNDSE